MAEGRGSETVGPAAPCWVWEAVWDTAGCQSPGWPGLPEYFQVSVGQRDSTLAHCPSERLETLGWGWGGEDQEAAGAAVWSQEEGSSLIGGP